ncbi:hypothetical protein NM208_g7072 [Fusarium decemcellulare]|uniref:Uncharacterized protein n=1 Tax=Fusarium decemcellulare TaxID=57161 RepID=A0ACC1SAV7_9HYPO|nr:hypothetical protein NM208_g7072 [Fusarium decemcellulare]
MTLKRIDENLRSIGPELDFILSQVGQGIRPHIHLQDYNRGWILRALDAVDYCSQYLVPIFQLLSRHVDKAIVRLSAANTTLASHREHYELVAATGGVAHRTSMRYSSDTQTKWSSWFLKEETAKIQYVLENKTINEMLLVAKRSAEMRQFLKTDDEEWNYYKIRPQRPPLH